MADYASQNRGVTFKNGALLLMSHPSATSGYNRLVNTDFLDRLATQLKTDKSAVCRRAIQRILAVVRKNLADGKYKNAVEAEADLRQLVDRDEGCK
jgi:hypothetical protein